ncbi:MAG: hypothetical protein CM1200mP33_2010 [Chloroflexota bacterium]|nr:MAG: hypothetical protein CM1200mP33_2010 [Chloroflexota bacterium]
MKILISDPITENGISILKDAKLMFFICQKLVLKKNKSFKRSAWMDYSKWNNNYSQMIESSKNLQVIGRAGVGVDNINIPVATAEVLFYEYPELIQYLQQSILLQ